jgi:SAM-dependent MidA family methyltransferase
MGPGDGQFAREVLPWISKRFPELAQALRYTAVEQSATMLKALRQSLDQALRSTRIAHQCLQRLPDHAAIEGCIFCHEFFDAQPFHILIWREGRWKERFVAFEGDRLVWQEDDPSNSELLEQAERRFEPGIAANDREDGWQAEVSPVSMNWAKKLEKSLTRGELLVVDYGYTLDEWQLGRFREGSAMAYREHKAITDLLANPGEQDLTAHVNFDIFLDAIASQTSRPDIRLRSQSRFLMSVGEADEFAGVFADCADENERLQRARQLKSLILPEGMGTTFQVLQLRKIW